MNITRKGLEKSFGKRCKEYAPLCIVCEVHRALDMLEVAYDYKPKKKKK